MLLPSLSYQEARTLPGLRVVDVRSPAEYAEDHIPGADLVPLLDDAQRALVGTLFRQESASAALAEGLNLVRDRIRRILYEVLGHSIPEAQWQAKFDALVPLVEELEVQRQSSGTNGSLGLASGEPPILVQCWRGGQRSRALVALLRALGFEQVYHLHRGYKGYRAWVRTQLEDLQFSAPWIILRGATGVGKTRLLQELEQKCPGSTLDLEGLAGHRSSILGGVGLKPVSQKRFESLLVARLQELDSAPGFVEGESRKIGDRLIPPVLFAAMEAGLSIRITASKARRVQNLLADYQGDAATQQELRTKLPFLEARLGKKWTGKLVAMLDRGQAAEVAESLLEAYYDPLYGHSDQRRSWVGEFCAEDPAVTADLLAFRLE